MVKIFIVLFFHLKEFLFLLDVIHVICKTIMLERRPAWDVVIHQGDPGDT